MKAIQTIRKWVIGTQRTIKKAPDVVHVEFLTRKTAKKNYCQLSECAEIKCSEWNYYHEIHEMKNFLATAKRVLLRVRKRKQHTSSRARVFFQFQCFYVRVRKEEGERTLYAKYERTVANLWRYEHVPKILSEKCTRMNAFWLVS